MIKPALIVALFVGGGLLMEKFGVEHRAWYALFGYFLGGLHMCLINMED